MRTGPHYIALAIPLFFALIGIEVAAASWRRRGSVYSFADTVADLGCGIGQQAVGIFFGGWLFVAYGYLNSRYAIAHLRTESAGTWIGCFLLTDIAYYFWHRASHRVNFLWSVHVVHHQSQEYNLAVALRQAWFTSLTSLPFYLPLAILGFPRTIFVASHAFNTLYQFWIHTRLISKLGSLESVFNTPSHHRVHHAINPGYIDKNYAAVLIVWDRIFGSYAEEAERPFFGTVKPFESWNSIWANFEYPLRLVREARHAQGLSSKLAHFIGPPERRVDGRIETVPEIGETDYRRFPADTSRRSALYVTLNLILVVSGVFLILIRQDSFGTLFLVFAVLLILLTTAITSGVLERRRWVPLAETARGAVGLALLILSR